MRSIADVRPRRGKRLLLAVAFAAADLCLLGQPLPQQPQSTHAKLMILGTFHFDDAGLDDYKPKYRLDLLSPTRQQEVKALVDALRPQFERVPLCIGDAGLVPGRAQRSGRNLLLRYAACGFEPRA